MAVRFRKSLVLTLILYLCIGVVYQVESPITDQAQSYLEFVLTTDFDMEFLLQPYNQIRVAIDGYDFSKLLQGLPRIATGW